MGERPRAGDLEESEKGRPEVAPRPALCLLGAKEAEVGTAGTPQP